MAWAVSLPIKNTIKTSCTLVVPWINTVKVSLPDSKWHLAVSSQLRTLPINMSAFLSLFQTQDKIESGCCLVKYTQMLRTRSYSGMPAPGKLEVELLITLIPKAFLEIWFLIFRLPLFLILFKYLDEPLNLQSEMTPHLLSAFPWISIIFLLF